MPRPAQITLAIFLQFSRTIFLALRHHGAVIEFAWEQTPAAFDRALQKRLSGHSADQQDR